jgi:hypothetical protein
LMFATTEFFDRRLSLRELLLLTRGGAGEHLRPLLR